MTIEWRKDWKPSELEAGDYHIKRIEDGWETIVRLDRSGIGFMLDSAATVHNDRTAGRYLLGPRISIDDAAEVKRLRGIVERIGSYAYDCDNPVVAARALAQIGILCTKALFPERQEAGDGE